MHFIAETASTKTENILHYYICFILIYYNTENQDRNKRG